MPCSSHPCGTEAPYRSSGGRKVVQVRRDGGPVSPDPRAVPLLYHRIGLPALPFLLIRRPISAIPAAPAVTAGDAARTVLVIPSARRSRPSRALSRSRIVHRVRCPLTPDLEEDDRRGDGGVERFDFAFHGNGH